jgi:hypothetical protein
MDLNYHHRLQVAPVMLVPTNKQVTIMPEMVNAVICPDTVKSLEHNELLILLRYKIRWIRSTANKIARLTQGIKRGITGTNTIKFMRREDVPAGLKVTYESFVVDIKAHKEKTECIHLTLGEDKIEYPGDKSTRTSGLTTAKMLLNSTIYIPGARFLLIGINSFYLNTPLGRYEYIVVLMSSLPQEVIDKYGLDKER